MKILLRLRKTLCLSVGLCLILVTFSLLSPHPTAQALKQSQPQPDDSFIRLFIRLAKKIDPTVVNISTTSHTQTRRQGPPRQLDPFDMFDPFFNPFFGIPQQQRPHQSLGTGFIIRKDGLIITNNHVIDGANVIRVSLSHSKEIYTAEVIGQDHRTDIALIKIKSKKDLPFVELGDSDELQVGEWVAAFGNPFGQTNSMSKGIISAIGRKIDELNRYPFLQTDASINPGNSGGPLVNTKGQVIGVNTAVHAKAQGIGFAIPINNIKAILPSLEKEGGFRRGFLGVSLVDVIPEETNSLGLDNTEGALITNVIVGSPAERAGLKPYDFIIQVDGKKIKSRHGLTNTIADSGVGKKIKLKLIRNGKKRSMKVTLGSHPQDKKVSQRAKAKKPYRGKKVPSSLGFTVMDYNQALKEGFHLPPLNKKSRPVVIDVEPDSPAHRVGLLPGDVILDVNKRSVNNTRDALEYLKKRYAKRSKTNRLHLMRILRGSQVYLLYLHVPK